MNVSCPECRSIFRVDPAKVPAIGVKARCSVCGGVITLGGARSVSEEFGTLSADRVEVAAIAVRVEADVTDAVEVATPSNSAPAVTASEPASRTQPQASAPLTRTTPVTPAVAAQSITPPQLASVPPARPPQAAPFATPPAIQRPAFGGGRPPLPPIPPIHPQRSSSISAVTPAAPAPAAPLSPQAPLNPGIGAQARTIPPVPPRVPGFTSGAPVGPPAAQPPRPTTASPARAPINPFLANDPNTKARRLARALVSDLVTYFPQRRDEGLRDGTLKQLFRDEIRKSYEEYLDQVGKELAESTSHFQDALNDILAGGQRTF